MSRRQTLGVLSPSQLNTRSNSNAPARVATTTKEAGCTAGPAVSTRSRKSLAPDKAAALLLAQGASMGGASVGGGPMGMSSGPGGLPDPRRSSAFNSSAKVNSSGVKQDPRPLSDKNFQAACIRTLITYLSTHGYPAAVSPKTLASPTAKDFTFIVQFLQQQFDPNLKSFGKIEDDVPLFFKRLNYPFQISKSALFAVGSPHSWPGVLAALTWLVELLNYNERIEGQQQSSQGSVSFTTGPGVLEDQESATKRQFYEYICTSYRYFLSGDDTRCAAVDQEMMSQFATKEEQLANAHARIKQASAQVAAEVARLQSEPSPLAAAQQRRAERAGDAEKFQQLIDNLQGMKANLLRRITERQEELAQRQEALTAVQRENDGLRSRIASQPVNKADLSRMVLERSKQKEVLEAVTAHSEELEQKLHEQEVQLVAVLKSLETSVARYNQVAHRLKLVPASSKRASGVAYELRINREASTPGEFASVDLRGAVKPGLEHLCDQYRTKAAQLGRDLLALRESAASSSEALREKQQENKAIEGMIAKLEVRLAALREEREQEVRGLSNRAEAVSQEVDGLRSTAMARAVEVEGRKRAVLAEHDQLVKACDAELAKLRTDLRAALEMLLQHRVYVQQVVSNTLTAVKQSQQELQQVQLPC